ncbi:Putative proteine similar to short chain dehydrogenase/reductase family oxidoreductase of Aspergillus clavatus [Podospora comata]|uniref:Uncharacterized protein n=1 Tax=Podospora comata TaxID=48703 RepID=A0ABY6S989_PODCO|nr:Putative proteine similar to short chain dehydrogenase/reductase family oxidoreductase of Aspergillus clavatus [Podospora comata]
MSTLPITPSLIPPLTGRTALITGGSSEITLSTALLLAEKGCSKVTILDPEHNDSLLTPDPGIPSCLAFLRVDVRNWKELKAAVKGCGEVDYAFYVPGPERILFEVGGEGDDDREGENGVGMDWAREVRTVGDFVKVCWAVMARSGVGRLGDEKGKGGSVVICVPGGAGGYMSCHVLPPVGMPGEGVMDGCAGSAILGMIRSLRTVAIQDGVAINGVAVGPTFPSTSDAMLPTTPLPPLTPGVQLEKLPVKTADEIALALVFSATATQKRKVEVYGKEKDSDLFAGKKEDRKWNGRVIFTTGTSPMAYTEVEEGLADLRGWWLGKENVKMVRMQQAVGDFRPFEVDHKREP